MENQPFDLGKALAILQRTPASLTALLNGLPDTWLTATEAEGTWSPYDVIGHLIHGERTDWILRTRHILAGDKRPFEPFDRLSSRRAKERPWPTAIKFR